MLLIENDRALVEICIELQGVAWLAVDTEFERVNTYYPELCLLQICNGDKTVIVDPLSIVTIEPLYELLYDMSIIKVFHSARQDLEIFFHLKGKLPEPLFDTQIAANLLGHDNQIGYANLIKAVLNIELTKSQTRTNWKRRPLSNNQLRYAADDVIYLAQVYEILLKQLKTSPKHSLLDKEFKALLRPELYEPDPGTVWQKIKMAKNLNGEPLVYLKKLAAWREKTARQENQPRKWILGDRILVKMAQSRPANMHELSHITGVNNQVVEKYGQSLLDILC